MRWFYLSVGLICIAVILAADLASTWWLVSTAGGFAAGTNIGHGLVRQRRRSA